MSYYGSTETVKIRTAATQETFGFDTETELDEFITQNLEEASSEIDRFCNRTFRLVENYTETRMGSGETTMKLKHDPIQDIHSLTEEGDSLTEGDTYKLKDTRNFDGENNGIVERLRDGKPRRNAEWYEWLSYTIEYDWGYPEAEVPQVLDNVADELVINRLNEAAAEREASGLESVSMDGYSVSYAIADASQKGVIVQEQLDRLKQLREVRIV